MTLAQAFTRFANSVAHATGRPSAFVIAFAVILGWAVTGPIFGWSDTWQLIINTGTTIVTFLMVFLIQSTQNRDSTAMQAKLDELIRALEGARNRFVGIEHLTEREVEAIRDRLENEAREAEQEGDHAEADALRRARERLAEQRDPERGA